MSLLKKFKQIKVFVFDIDGVLTNGSIYVFANGEQVRKMNIKDGFALQLAIKKGYRIMVMSGSHSDGVMKRLEKLGITDVYMNVVNKPEQFIQYLSKINQEPASALFMGDDIPDLGTMNLAGISCAPADAADDVRSAANYISPYAGGNGCVRDVIEKVLKLNDDWELDTEIPSR